MSKVFLTFDIIEIEKRDFTCYKIPALLSDVDIKKVSGSNKIPSGKKNL